jgi:hypothetical protein
LGLQISTFGGKTTKFGHLNEILSKKLPHLGLQNVNLNLNLAFLA